MDKQDKLCIIIMGVSGVGKTTIGKLLATHNTIPFFDGDDFHSATNITKMSSGQALNDEDRKYWLESLNTLLIKHSQLQGCVIACSALKESYRKVLNKSVEKATFFVYLHGSYEVILQRMQVRQNHFIPTSLLQSQFDTLEIPLDALQISIENSPAEIVKIIQTHIENIL